ncbi:MAG: hypothetical protein KKD48_01660 [Nanoarchaeota archaeon]|nr:hypothetical protein [Nanoarchaeota archaeon]
MRIIKRTEVVGTVNFSKILNFMGIMFPLAGIFFYVIAIWGFSWNIFFSMGFFLGGTMFMVPGLYFLISGRIKERNLEDVKKTGKIVKTKLFNVEMDQYLTVNYKHPYRISSTWKDPKTKKVYIFKSDAVWFNPERFVPKTINVYIKPENPNIYYMDISFLNKIFEENN